MGKAESRIAKRLSLTGEDAGAGLRRGEPLLWATCFVGYKQSCNARGDSIYAEMMDCAEKDEQVNDEELVVHRGDPLPRWHTQSAAAVGWVQWALKGGAAAPKPREPPWGRGTGAAPALLALELC